MPVHLLQATLNGGEAAPGLWHRSDLTKFSTWVRQAVNYFVRPQGGMSNRPGTIMQASTKNPAQKSRLFPFVFSKTQAYLLEIGAGYIRFFTPDGQLLDENDNVYEVATDITADELPDLYYCQSADVIYFARPGKRPAQLARYGHTNWIFSDYEYKYGPFKLQNNDEKLKISSCFTDNQFYLTCENDVFDPGDVGAWWKIKHTLKNVHFQQAASSSGNFTSANMLVNGEITLHTSGTWEGQIKLEYTNDPDDTNSWRTLRAVSSLSDYNCNDVVSIPAGLWWVRIVTAVTNGTAYVTLDCDEQQVDVFYKITRYENPMKVAAELVNNTKKLESYFSSGREFKSCIPTFTSGTAPSGTYSSLDTNCWHALDGSNDTCVTVANNATPENSGFSYTFPAPVVITSIAILGHNLEGSIGNATSNDQLILTIDNTTLTPRSEERGQRITFTADGVEYTNTWRILNVTPTVASQISFYFSASTASGNTSPKHLVRFVVRGYDYIAGQEVTINATDEWSEGAWSTKNGWPSCVCQHQGRLLWGWEDTVHFTQVGDNYSFATSSPLEDSDGISTTLRDEGINAVNALVSMKSLLAFTAGGVFASNSAVMTPTEAGIPKQSAVGGASVRPAVIGTRVLYVLPKNGKLHDTSYDYSTDAFDGADLCLIAEHLFENEQIIELAYQQEPYGLLWVLLGSGKLLCLTYVQAEQVCAWTQMETDGSVESIATIPGALRDELFLIVNRGGVRYVEKMADRLASTDIKEQFFVDCGRTYRGTAATVIGGLSYLEGKEVAILADGQVHPAQTVINGQITLQTAASVVHVGLPYTARLCTLCGDLNTDSGSVVARKKRYIGATISFVNSRSAQVGCDDDLLEPWLPEKPIVYNTGKALATEDLTFKFQGQSELMPSVIVQQKDPLPITVTAVTPLVQVGNI